MKTLILQRFISTVILAFISALLLGEAAAPKIERTKVIKKSYQVNENTNFSVTNQRGNIHFVNTDGNELIIEVTLIVKGKDEEEIQKVLDNYKLLDDTNPNDLEILGEDNIKNWTKIKTFFTLKNVIKFANGNKAENIDEISSDMVVYLPNIKKCRVENKYKSISYDKMPCAFEVELYSGKLKGGEISGDFELDAKYSDIKVGQTGNSVIDIYDSEFESKNMVDTQFKTKYSNIKIRDIRSMDLDSYDDKVILGDVEKEILCEAKYTQLETGKFGLGEFILYDSDVESTHADTLILESKYGSFEALSIKNVKLDLYTDKINLGMVSMMRIRESKYSKINIEEITDIFQARKSYDDEIEIEDVSHSLSSLKFEGKYTDLDFPLPTGKGYYINSKTKYGSLDLPEGFEYRNQCSDGSEKEIIGAINNGSESSPSIIIEAYDCNISLESSFFK